MQTITIDVTEATCIIHDGRLPKSRLKWHAPGLQIFIRGAIPVRKRDMVLYHAFDLCLAHHIPLVQLKSEGWV